MVQRQRLRVAAGTGTVGGKPPLDEFGGAGNPFQVALELWRLAAIGMAQSAVARGEGEDALPRLAGLLAGFLHRHAQHFAIAFGRNWQAMFEVPAGQAAFTPIVAQFDFAALERSAIG